MEITIYRPGGTDIYGNPIDGVEVSTADVIVAPRADSEATSPGRSAVIVGYTIYLPPGSDLRPTDRVIIDDVAYEVDGQVGHWVNPFTGIDRGYQAALRRVDG